VCLCDLADVCQITLLLIEMFIGKNISKIQPSCVASSNKRLDGKWLSQNIHISAVKDSSENWCASKGSQALEESSCLINSLQRGRVIQNQSISRCQILRKWVLEYTRKVCRYVPLHLHTYQGCKRKQHLSSYLCRHVEVKQCQNARLLVRATCTDQLLPSNWPQREHDADFPDRQGANPLPRCPFLPRISPTPKHPWSSASPTKLGPHQKSPSGDAPGAPHYLPQHLIPLTQTQLCRDARCKMGRTQVLPPAKTETITYWLVKLFKPLFKEVASVSVFASCFKSCPSKNTQTDFKKRICRCT